MPPLSFSIWVSVSEPTGLATLLAQIHDSASSASGPFSTNLAKLDWSKSPAASRAARCSRPTASTQLGRPKLERYSAAPPLPPAASHSREERRSWQQSLRKL